MMTIRGAQAADVPEILAFLDAHWKAGHIFTRDRALFDWQHALPEPAGAYSYILAHRDTDQALIGVLGYIPTRRFDASLGARNTVWLALWKVRQDAAAPGLGMRMARYLLDHESHAAAGVVLFQPEIAPLYRALRFTVGELQHYVMANPDVDQFALATFASRLSRVPSASDLDAVALDHDNFDELTAGLNVGARAAQAPLKSAAYFRSRYLEHPRYRYRCMVLRRAAAPVAILALREARARNVAALRIVDFFGADCDLAGIGAHIARELRTSGAEYADVYNAGIDPAIFERAGFSVVDPNGPDIVPDHFEPFERKNVRIRYAMSPVPHVVFKGDGDQDRPSTVIA